MSWPMILGCFWILAATITAFLPMRRQFVPGLALLIAAPILLVWVVAVHGIWVGLFGLFAFLSMFRRPLIYFAKKLMAST